MVRPVVVTHSLFEAAARVDVFAHVEDPVLARVALVQEPLDLAGVIAPDRV